MEHENLHDNQTINDTLLNDTYEPPGNSSKQDNSAGNSSSQDNSASNSSSQSNSPGNSSSQDNPASNSSSQDNPAGNSSKQDNPAGNSSIQDNLADNSSSQDNPAGNSISQDIPGGNSSSQDNPGGNSSTQDNPAGNSISQDIPAGNSSSQDIPAGNSSSQDNEAGEEKGREDSSLPSQDSKQRGEEFTPAENSLKEGDMGDKTSEKSQANEISEADPSSVWQSNQVVEDVVVRRRKGKSTSDTSEFGSKTQGTQETFIETHDIDTLEDDDSPEGVKKRDKIKKIQTVLSSEPLDLGTLKELAISEGGLLDDELRKEAWPLLMGLKVGETEMKPEMKVVEGHRDYQQVVLDVKRTLKRFPPGIEDSRRIILMDQLIVLIIRVLMRHPDLYYYQGYHDVAITFLLVTGEDMGFQLVEKLSVTHLRDFMRATMERTSYYLTYLYPILENAHPLLHECLEKSGVGTVFCLPWLITWFAHTLSDYRHVVRLYDFFLASPELMPMYIATAIVLQKEEELLGDKEKEVSSIFAILSKDPDNLPFEDILVRARELYQSYPPDTLTERVEKIIAKREEEEKKEKQRIEEIRKKADSYRKNTSLMGKILAYLPVPVVVPVQRGKIIKLALFTASIILARSLYKHYYTSAIDFPLHTQ